MTQSERRLVIHATSDGVARAGVETLLETARERAGRSLKARVALSGGSTPKRMYEMLRELKGDDLEQLLKVRYFFGDERSVPNGHPDSNVGAANDGFLRPLGVPENLVYAPNGGAYVLSAEAWRLSLVLDRVLPKAADGKTPMFDLIFLGMGEDGHTASLFPGTEALQSDERGYVMNEVPQLNTNRLTLTYPVLNAAKKLCLLITGKGKATVLKEIFTRGSAAPVYPVEALAAPSIVWHLDEAAASELPDAVRKLAEYRS